MQASTLAITVQRARWYTGVTPDRREQVFRVIIELYIVLNKAVTREYVVKTEAQAKDLVEYAEVYGGHKAYYYEVYV
jgi:hypothetical protein